MLEYTAARGLPVWGFELGNEKQITLTPKETADALSQVRTIIDELWPDDANRPVLIGPALNPRPDWLQEMLEVISRHLPAKPISPCAPPLHGTNFPSPAHASNPMSSPLTVPPPLPLSLSADVAAQVGGGAAVDGVSYHSYSGYGLSPVLSDLIRKPAWIDFPIGITQQHLQAVRNAGFHSTPLYISETALAWNSGKR